MLRILVSQSVDCSLLDNCFRLLLWFQCILLRVDYSGLVRIDIECILHSRFYGAYSATRRISILTEKVISRQSIVECLFSDLTTTINCGLGFLSAWAQACIEFGAFWHKVHNFSMWVSTVTRSSVWDLWISWAATATPRKIHFYRDALDRLGSSIPHLVKLLLQNCCFCRKFSQISCKRHWWLNTQ